jgi:PAS domain S-box-containing protein/putative nucleotidyltransferase with HDIG domain
MDDAGHMAAYLHGPGLARLRPSPTLGRTATPALALALFGGIFALRALHRNVADADEILYVVPIALLALRFGLRGGLAGALASVALLFAWDLYKDPAALSTQGYASRAVAFILLGALLGDFVDKRRRLEAEVVRYFDASLDLLATADLKGRFTRVNPAWERALGYSPETMCSRPFIEFVHPEDREATIAETAALSRGSRDTVRFRNRYRAVDGRYLWLEWSATGSPSEGVIHAVARDITVQCEAEQQLASNAHVLEVKVARRTQELEAARAETLQRLALAAEFHDEDTSRHTERVGVTAAEIAAKLGLDAEQVRLVREAAPLHDVGKLAIPDPILLKPGKLTAEEYEVMKTHAELGARLLSGSSSRELRMAAIIAESHHERWDGSGYPAGLAREAIPLVGRIVAVADVFDALTHNRPYKRAWPVERATAEIRRGAGSQFDPAVVAAFLALHADSDVAPIPGPQQRPPSPRPPRRRLGGKIASPASRSARHA